MLNTYKREQTKEETKEETILRNEANATYMKYKREREKMRQLNREVQA